MYPDLENSRSYFVGATISPFKSYRYYWQAEFVNSLHSYDGTTTMKETHIQNVKEVRQLQRTTTLSENSNVNWEIPVLMRYNINNFVGVGAGIQANINATEKTTNTTTTDIYEGKGPGGLLLSSKTQATSSNNSFTNLKTGLLFDLTIGAARIGPSLGARYVMNFEDNFNYFQFYGIWKF
jgi:hypothetical protein